MNFLAPAFLLGALAIAGPILFHLIRRTTRERQRFGSLMFLEPTPPRMTRRSRLEHWLLLLLRAIALALLALTFARPFFLSGAPAVSRDPSLNRTVVLVDASASLRRDGMWNQAKERAMKAVETAAADSDVALASFDSSVNLLLSFDDWRGAAPGTRAGLARERLDAVDPSWTGTNAAAALMSAAEMLAESAQGTAASGRREIILVTDAQEGSRLEKLQGYEWPRDVRLLIETVKPGRAGNAGLHLAAESSNAETQAVPAVRLRVTNSPDAEQDSFQIGWQADGSDGFSGPAVSVYVPPGQSRITTLPWPEAGPKAGRVILRGDSAGFDNTITVAPPASVVVPVIFSGLVDDPRGPYFFLQKALPAGRALTATPAPHAVGAIPPPDLLRTAPLWIIADALDAPVAAAAGDYAAAGGTALIMLQSPGMAATLEAVAGGPPLTLTAVKPASFALLGTIDFGHPLFTAFADPRFSDFTKIRFWSYLKPDAALPGNARVVAAFDSGDPAVLEIPRGKGRVFVLTAGWHPAASQLALSSKFPSLLASLLTITGAGVQFPPQLSAGEPVAASSLVPVSSETLSIISPDGKTSPLSRTDIFTGFSVPGLYRVTWDGGGRDLAVNLDPAESRTAPLAVDDYEKLGAPVAAGSSPVRTAAAPGSPAAAVETESRQKLWRWVLAAAVAVLLIETMLGTRAARRYVPAEGGSSP